MREVEPPRPGHLHHLPVDLHRYCYFHSDIHNQPQLERAGLDVPAPVLVAAHLHEGPIETIWFDKRFLC